MVKRVAVGKILVSEPKNLYRPWEKAGGKNREATYQTRKISPIEAI